MLTAFVQVEATNSLCTYNFSCTSDQCPDKFLSRVHNLKKKREREYSAVESVEYH